MTDDDATDDAMVPLTSGQMRAIADGRRAEVGGQLGLELPDEIVAGSWWGYRADLLDAHPDDPWSAVRLLVRDSTVVGNAGFHGPPDADGMVEVGYTVLPAYRRRGVARAALATLTTQARRAPEVRMLRATVAPDNEASLGLVRSAGLVQVGEQWDDEDGRELVFELPVGPGDTTGGIPDRADWLAENRAAWDLAAPEHAAGDFYDLPGFVAGRDDLRPFEDVELGPVDGLDLVHLQCHLGTDTLSLSRRGARVVGLDLSAESVAVARRLAVDTGLAAEFVVGDVRDAVEVLGGRRFDVVYTGVGALCWLPDLDVWADVVARLLRPGGVLYLVEIHPLIEAVAEDGWVISSDVVGRPFTREVYAGSYGAAEGRVGVHANWERTASPARVVTAVAGAGLRVELLAEQTVTDNPLPWLVRGPDRLSRFPPGRPVYPLTWSLRARAPR